MQHLKRCEDKIKKLCVEQKKGDNKTDVITKYTSSYQRYNQINVSDTLCKLTSYIL